MELSRRNLLQLSTFGMAASALSLDDVMEGAYAALPTAGSDGATGAPFLPYSSDSFFKSRVDGLGGRPVAPVDAARTSAFRNFMSSFPDQKPFSAPTIKGLGTNKWGTVYAMAQPGDPIWKLTGSVPADVAWLKTTGFHAPSNFGQRLTGTSDSPFVVQDLASGWSVWAAKSAPGSGNTINVGAAGAFKHVSNGLDKRNPKHDAAGAGNFRSRGAIPDGMVIRRDLVDYGIANNTGLGHVLHMFMCETNKADGHCHPMVGEESQSGWGAEGERIFIRKSVDLTTRNLSPFGLVIARTLQEHGCYLGDNAGGESTLKAAQTSSVSNPWAGLTVSDKVLLGKVTWADFDVASRGWQ
jgi:hypothetical protein